jgi:iron-sulfur cluster repair protein YtfE (RIC family)
MSSATDPLREEHRHLVPHIELLRTLADSIGTADQDSIRSGVEEAYEFLTRHLTPHAEAEDKALYPVVARVLGAPKSTATMSRDHVQVGRLTAELDGLRARIQDGSPTAAEVTDLRRVLYGLHALVSVHFAKEEEIYLPILDESITSDEATEMFAAMEEAAAAAKSN